jgi:hypothetical protein
MSESVPNGSSRVYRNQHPYNVQVMPPHSKARADSASEKGSRRIRGSRVRWYLLT